LSFRTLLIFTLGPLLGCAASPAPPTAPPPPVVKAAPAKEAPAPAVTAKEPPPDAAAPEPTIRPAVVEPDATMETKHLTEKQWQAEVRAKIAKQLDADPTELRFSSDKQWVLAVKGPPPPPAGKPIKHPRRWTLVVTDSAGKRRIQFHPVTLKGSDEPPKEAHFLADNRVIYEVVQPPPAPLPPPKAAKAKKGKHAKPAKPAPKAPPKPVVEGPPPRLFVIQPLSRRRPQRVQSGHVAFTAQQDHLAYLGGDAEAAFVGVDGAQVYPRKGRAVIPCDPVWSKDGHSVAFLEQRPHAPARLVLLAEYDNPTGDTTWDLPASAVLEGARVFWAGSGKLVVGKSSMRPIFAATFFKEKPPPSWREP
jgi:hypothetical protein